MGRNVTELWGREFNIVKNGLSEAQVVSYVDELIKEHDMLIQRQEHLASLTKLAERTVAEAEKLAEESKREAIDQAEAEASRIIAEAEERAQRATEEKEAEIIARATEQAETIKAGATEQAEAIKASAEQEAGLLLDSRRKGIESELRDMAQRLYSQLFSQLDGLKEQAVAMGEEFERKLSQPVEHISTATVDVEDTSEATTQLEELLEDVSDSANHEEQLQANLSQSLDIADQTSKAEGEVLVSGNGQAPATYEEKVELEFLPPINILQILEINNYLESLPEVEATEIIPIADKPAITVFLRESVQLTDILDALPEVSQLRENTNGEVTADSGDTQAEGKSRKIEITLSGDNNTDSVEG